jgi:carbamoyl-phosphate synthase small subunit
MKEASLLLEDGTKYRGISFGTEESVSGEIVFNTGMVGYYESLTDPSYKGQILVLTYPLIGNYGVPGEAVENQLSKNFESDRIHASALVVADYSYSHNHWNATRSLSDWLKQQGIPAIHHIDTRSLTKILREKGTMLGKITFTDDIEFYDPNRENLIKKVTIKEPVVYNAKGKRKIVVVDCGVKYNILRSLIERECCVIRVPCNYDFFEHAFDGVVVSNGPGDPKMCQETIALIRRCYEKAIPTFGICLGNQLMALAAGANTYKLKYGHRSQNQPCLQAGTKRCFITSQNHGYAVETKTLHKDWESWFINVNDDTNEGIRHKNLPFMSVQFHPEHRPGPVDTAFLFDKFLEFVR